MPGIRLGVLASANEEIIAHLKKDVAIWNINSFGEYFMQILEKYSKDYAASLESIKHSRSLFVEELSEISYLRVIPSQANYIMCEVLNGYTSRGLSEKLLQKDILIKDLSTKVTNGKQYIRLAVRNEEDNQRLVEALHEYCN